MSEKSIVDEIIEALKGKKTLQATNELIEQLKNERALFDRFRNAGLPATTEEVQGRARLRPEGILSKVEKVDRIDLIDIINDIKLIDLITRIQTIDTITNIGNMTLLAEIDKLNKINPEDDVVIALPVVSRAGSQNWGSVGSEPFLNVADGTSYIGIDSPNNIYSGQYQFADLPTDALAIVSVILRLRVKHAYPLTGRELIVYIGSSTKNLFITTSDWAYLTVDITDILDTVAKVNDASLEVRNAWSTPSYTGCIDYAELLVTYTGARTVIDKVKEIVSMPPVTQATRTNLKAQPEREDLLFKRFSNIFAGAGDYAILDAVADQKHKVFSYGFRVSADIEACIRDGTSNEKQVGLDDKMGFREQSLFNPFMGTVNTALNCRAEGACTVKGWIQYITEA